MGRTADRARAARQRALDRVRHARHPLRGIAKWVLIGFQTLAAVFGLFCLINLGLSLSTFRGEDPAARMAHELGVLWFSTPNGQPTSGRAFEVIHGAALGTAPTAQTILAHFEAASEGGTFLLDQIMVDRMEAVNGRIDGRVLPSGIYVGAHALGPDSPPLVWVTKWLAHYMLFPRHAYILVVPVTGPALVFSASQNAKFPGDSDAPNQLTARITPFDDRAYDFPSSGEALHEMTIVSRDPAVVAGAPAALDEARARLDAMHRTYGLLAPNSNTVVGCILEDADLMEPEVRRSTLLAFRAPGLGAACPDRAQGS